MKTIKVLTENMYHISEETIKKYESKEIEFKTKNDDPVKIRIFGRSGDGYHCMFLRE